MANATRTKNVRTTINLSVPVGGSLKDVINALRRADNAGGATLDAGADIRVKGVHVQVATPKVSDIRSWGIANGYDLGSRGRYPQALLDAYAAAHAPKPLPRKRAAK